MYTYQNLVKAIPAADFKEIKIISDKVQSCRWTSYSVIEYSYLQLILNLRIIELEKEKIYGSGGSV